MTIDQAKLDKLPAWAKQLISEQARELEKFHAAHVDFIAQLEAYEAAAKSTEVPHIVLEPYRGLEREDKQRGHLFSHQSLIEVMCADDRIQVGVNDDAEIKITTSLGRLLVVGSASNSVIVQSEQSLIAKRARDLKHWEERIRRGK